MQRKRGKGLDVRYLEPFVNLVDIDEWRRLHFASIFLMHWLIYEHLETFQTEPIIFSFYSFPVHFALVGWVFLSSFSLFFLFASSSGQASRNNQTKEILFSSRDRVVNLCPADICNRFNSIFKMSRRLAHKAGQWFTRSSGRPRLKSVSRTIFLLFYLFFIETQKKKRKGIFLFRLKIINLHNQWRCEWWSIYLATIVWRSRVWKWSVQMIVPTMSPTTNGRTNHFFSFFDFIVSRQKSSPDVNVGKQ